jgi:predicted alpha/beta superfamily hydrolase
MSGLWADSGRLLPGAASGAGRLLAHPPVGGRGVPPRRLLAYLPAGVERPARRLPVVVFHDGQNVFDEGTAFASSWRAGETLDALAAEGLPLIGVAVPNLARRRLHEYAPFVDRRWGGGGAELYLRYLAERVVPLVAGSFRLAAPATTTALVGSSMGGLVSLWGKFRRPDVFGLCAAMSPTLFWADLAIFDFVERQPFVGGRIWLDVGTREGRRPRRRAARPAKSPSGAMRRLRRLRRLLEEKGWRRDEDLAFVEEPGATHDETSWARRLPDALRFLYAAG